MSALVCICWGAWGLVWAIGWLANLTAGPATERRSLGWSFWVVVLLVAVGMRMVPGLRAAAATSAWLAGLGAALLLVGTAFTLWARWVLGGMWSSQPSVRAGHELRTSGPYAITRHPIHTGMTAMMAGTALMAGGLWIALLLLFAVYIALKMREEERLMGETFGEAYARYRHSTPQIVPGLRRR